MWRASSAATHRAVAQISRAREANKVDERFCSREVGTSPRIGSFIENLTSSATTRRSHARASWKPAPTAVAVHGGDR